MGRIRADSKCALCSRMYGQCWHTRRPIAPKGMVARKYNDDGTVTFEVANDCRRLATFSHWCNPCVQGFYESCKRTVSTPTSQSPEKPIKPSE